MNYRYKPAFHLKTLVMSLGLAAASQAQVIVKDPWVGTTVPSQHATGAFVQLTSTQDV